VAVDTITMKKSSLSKHAFPSIFMFTVLALGVTGARADIVSPPPSREQIEKQEQKRRELLLEAKNFPLPKGFQKIYLLMPLPEFLKTHKNVKHRDPDLADDPKVIDPKSKDVRLAEDIAKHPLVYHAEYAFEWNGLLTSIILDGEFKKKTPKGTRHELLEHVVSLYGAPTSFDVLEYGVGEKWGYKCAGINWSKDRINVFVFVYPEDKGKQFMTVCIQSVDAAEFGEDYPRAENATEAEKKQLLASVRSVVEQLVARQKSVSAAKP